MWLEDTCNKSVHVLLQADPKSVLTHNQMMIEYPRFSENLKRELTDEEKAKYIVSNENHVC